MPAYEDYIFCNHQVHAQFSAIAEILGMIVAVAPRPISVIQMRRETNRSVLELRQICMDLADVRLLVRYNGRHDQWLLNKDAKDVTLDDVYACLLQSQARLLSSKSASPEPAREAAPEPGRFQGAIDALIMQATMGVNQSARSHLRSFFLDRVKMSVAAPNLAARNLLVLGRRRKSASAAGHIE